MRRYKFRCQISQTRIRRVINFKNHMNSSRGGVIRKEKIIFAFYVIFHPFLHDKIFQMMKINLFDMEPISIDLLRAESFDAFVSISNKQYRKPKFKVGFFFF